MLSSVPLLISWYSLSNCSAKVGYSFRLFDLYESFSASQAACKFAKPVVHSSSVGFVFQGLVLFFLLGADFLNKYKVVIK